MTPKNTSPKDPDIIDAEYALTRRLAKYLNPIGECVVKGFDCKPENVIGITTQRFGKEYTIVSVKTENHEAHGLATRGPNDKWIDAVGVGTALSRACKKLCKKFLVRKGKATK